MKEKIQKVKDFLRRNQEDIVVGGIVAFSIAMSYTLMGVMNGMVEAYRNRLQTDQDLQKELLANYYND